jgi:hypothetical protein
MLRLTTSSRISTLSSTPGRYGGLLVVDPSAFLYSPWRMLPCAVTKLRYRESRQYAEVSVSMSPAEIAACPIGHSSRPTASLPSAAPPRYSATHASRSRLPKSTDRPQGRARRSRRTSPARSVHAKRSRAHMHRVHAHRTRSLRRSTLFRTTARISSLTVTLLSGCLATCMSSSSHESGRKGFLSRSRLVRSTHCLAASITQTSVVPVI